MCYKHFVLDEPEEVIMAEQDVRVGEQKQEVTKPIDPQSLSFIERIFYFEHQNQIEASNDNKRSVQDSACFDCWAMPDYMRK
jgi:hypothetical protein